jgi:hypothetical protein
MDDKKIVTQSGYAVVFSTFLTYDQFIEIQKLWTANAVVNAATGTPDLGNIPANVMHDANKLAMSFLIKSITDKAGNPVPHEGGSLPLPPVDGMEIVTEINKIMAEASAPFTEKKTTN